MRFSWRVIRWPIWVCIAVFALYYVPPVRDALVTLTSPLVRLVRHSFESTFDTARTISSIPNLAKENGALKAQINELKALENTNTELQHENDLLRKELNLGSINESQTRIAAQVISRSASVSLQSITVNKGSNDGFTKGMAVIAQGHLVGQVDEVLPHTSTVRLVTSVNSLLPVVLQNSRSVGLLKGGTEGLIIDEIPRDVTIAPGERVVTANLGDVINSGIPVGTVSVVLSGKSDVFQSARLVSPIDLSRLEVVFGVK